MKISTYTDFKSAIDSGPSVCVFAVDNGTLNEDWREIFNNITVKYKSSMFLRFSFITTPLSEDIEFIKIISNASCLIVDHTSTPTLTSTLCNDLGDIPVSVCSANYFSGE